MWAAVKVPVPDQKVFNYVVEDDVGKRAVVATRWRVRKFKTFSGAASFAEKLNGAAACCPNCGHVVES